LDCERFTFSRREEFIFDLSVILPNFVAVTWNTVEKRWFVMPRLHDTIGCQSGCQTGLTTGWMFVYTMQPVVKPVCQQVVSCKRGFRFRSFKTLMVIGFRESARFTMPNFVKICQTLAEIWRLSNFQDDGQAARTLKSPLQQIHVESHITQNEWPFSLQQWSVCTLTPTNLPHGFGGNGACLKFSPASYQSDLS